MERISEQLKEIAPRSSEGYLFQATARLNQGDFAGAEAGLNQLIRLAPENSGRIHQAWTVTFTQKRWNESAGFVSRGAQPSP